MAKQSMTRRASDNVYLHRDFHGALSTAIQYLHQTYGEQAVRGYLRTFALHYYAPLTRDIRERGLLPLQEYLERTFRQEDGDFWLECTEDTLTLHVEACPAITYMQQHGYAVAPMFCETSKTVYATIVEGTPFCFSWLDGDELAGRCTMRFSRRQA